MRDRLAAETPEEREARLQHMSTSGRNVDFWCATNHVTVPTASWAVRIQWTHPQSATRCGLLRQILCHDCPLNLTSLL